MRQFTFTFKKQKEASEIYVFTWIFEAAANRANVHCNGSSRLRFFLSAQIQCYKLCELPWEIVEFLSGLSLAVDSLGEAIKLRPFCRVIEFLSINSCHWAIITNQIIALHPIPRCFFSQQLYPRWVVALNFFLIFFLLLLLTQLYEQFRLFMASSYEWNRRMSLFVNDITFSSRSLLFQLFLSRHDKSRTHPSRNLSYR